MARAPKPPHEPAQSLLVEAFSRRADRPDAAVSGGALGQEPLAILTTLDVKTADDARRVANIYLNRWGVEEANRFTKQGFDLEDVRALTWTGLKRMV